ncbi:MAG: ABC-F family ATP-binding cassette domain-containing protein [Planctomycetes bacterium]|nr:ABC-F family ATP-binding cassette domain-containing protein [Planctomycetota bacterium]
MARSWPSGERLLRVEVALGPRSSVSAAEALVLELRAGDVVGLLGDTARGDALLAHLATAEGGDTPEVRRLAPEVSLGVLGEAPAPREDLDVRGALRAPVQHLRAIEERYLRACEDPEGREPEVEHLRELMDRHDVWTLDGRVQDVAAGLEVPAPETRLADVDEVARRRVALAALLLRESDVLVLDDPARGLSAAGARWLCGDLRRRLGAVLLRAPARRLLRDVAVELLEPDRRPGGCPAGT